MGRVNETIAYGFGQMGSGHIKASTALYPPTGRVIVAITMLEPVQFLADVGLVADDSYAKHAATNNDDGVSFFGSGTQYATNGTDNDADAVTSAVLANTVKFPTGLTIYGRWTRFQLKTAYTHGVIVYYGE
tara:strand:- start:972 stop:1364 length:393 start_codon:yes stop_codon:yes gene_type:complete